MKHIPNIITLSNLFAGCLATVFAFKGDPLTATWFVMAGAVLDFLDGSAARILKAGSPIGKQLDSLADLITFGMAPAAVMFHFLHTSLVYNQSGMENVLPYLAFFLVVFSALRLGKFNIDDNQSDTFTGLPTPANALFLVSLPLALSASGSETLLSGFFEWLSGCHHCLLAWTAMQCFLLISPIRMFSLKFKKPGIAANSVRYLFLAGSLIILLLGGRASLFLIMLWYILLASVMHMSNTLKAKISQKP